MQGYGNGSIHGRRTNRRRALQIAAMAGASVAASLALGCQGEQPAAQVAQTSPRPKRGGIVRDPRFDVLSGRTMDPHTNTSTSNKMRRLWYQGLLGYNMRTVEVEPELAQKWQQPSQTEYIFTLQPGVKWHNKVPVNGRELTVDDILYSLNRARTDNPAYFHASLLTNIDKMEAVDRSTIRITTKELDAVTLLKLASDGPLIMAQEAVEKAGKFVTGDTVVGTGPFIAETAEERLGAESVRNPEYWKPGKPYLDGFSYKFVGEEQAKYAALVSGAVDLVNVGGNDVKDYLNRRGPNFTPEYAKDNVATNWLTPNMRVKPFDDSRVTRALRLILDYRELISGWGQLWYPQVTFGAVFPAVLDTWDYSNEEYGNLVFWKQPKDQAIKEGLDLLNAAGFNRTSPLAFESSVHVNTRGNQQEGLGVLVQDQWRRLSQGVVTTELKILDGAQATQARATGGFTYGMLANAGAMDDPDSWFTQIFRTRGSRNYAAFSDPEIDALIDKQRTIFDLQQRRAAVKETVRLLVDRTAATQPGRLYYLNGTNPNLRDYVPEGSVTQGRQFEQVWLDS